MFNYLSRLLPSALPDSDDDETAFQMGEELDEDQEDDPGIGFIEAEETEMHRLKDGPRVWLFMYFCFFIFKFIYLFFIN
jgi:hypothetical protein